MFSQRPEGFEPVMRHAVIGIEYIKEVVEFFAVVVTAYEHFVEFLGIHALVIEYGGKVVCLLGG